eukprot:gene10764-12536_t
MKFSDIDTSSKTSISTSLPVNSHISSIVADNDDEVDVPLARSPSKPSLGTPKFGWLGQLMSKRRNHVRHTTSTGSLKVPKPHNPASAATSSRHSGSHAVASNSYSNGNSSSGDNTTSSGGSTPTKRKSILQRKSLNQQTSSSITGDRKEFNKRSNLTSSKSCNQLSIDYISTKHEMSSSSLLGSSSGKRKSAVEDVGSTCESSGIIFPVVQLLESDIMADDQMNKDATRLSISVGDDESLLQQQMMGSHSLVPMTVIDTAAPCSDFEEEDDYMPEEGPSSSASSSLHSSAGQGDETAVQQPRTIPWSRSKHKSNLHTRSSAPQLMSSKIGARDQSPVSGSPPVTSQMPPHPPHPKSLSVSSTEGKCHSSPELEVSSDSHALHPNAAQLLKNNLSNNRSASDTYLPRGGALTNATRTTSAWVVGMPSSPPVAPLPCVSPNESSPDSCLSPISSMIRVYYVPLCDDDVIPPFAISDHHHNVAIESLPPLSRSNTSITPMPIFANYWTQLVTSVMTVKDVINNLSTKLDMNPEHMRLCLSVDQYDYLEEERLLAHVRKKKFYLMEIAQEVIVHESASTTSLHTLVQAGMANMTSTNTLSSNSLTASVGSLSSWSCKFLSTSNRRRAPLHDAPDDFLLDVAPYSASLNAAYVPNPAFSLHNIMQNPLAVSTPNAGSDSASIVSNEEWSKPLKEKIKILDNYFHHYYREIDSYLVARKKRMETLYLVLNESGVKENSIAWQRCIRENLKKESAYLRMKRSRIGPSDFQKLTVIGKGGFGKVYLAKKKDPSEIVTLKVIRKTWYHRANQMTSVSKEKEVMMIPHMHKDHSQWITRLLYSFQDAKFMYLAMEYHCGGDFRALLKNLVCLADDIAPFYMAEMILAIESLHKLGYIHRDLKPSNFVVDKNGHLKLIDFGLSKEGFISRNSQWKVILNNNENSNGSTSLKETAEVKRHKHRNNKVNIPELLMQIPEFNNYPGGKKDKRPNKDKKISFSKVGSPEYMAPEMLSGRGYDLTYDYWSLGVVFFEMLLGDTPFGGDTPEEVFQNILDWKKVIDWEALRDNLSDNAIDLLKNLLCEPEKRATTEELKAHPYFAGLDWENVKNMVPPFVPQVQNELDTSYFEGAVDLDDQDDEEDAFDEAMEAANEAMEGCDPTEPPTDDDSFRSMPFGGFTFQRFPSIVEGARMKGLVKSFYVEERSCVSRATSTNSLMTSPASESATNSPALLSANNNNPNGATNKHSYLTSSNNSSNRITQAHQSDCARIPLQDSPFTCIKQIKE